MRARRRAVSTWHTDWTIRGNRPGKPDRYLPHSDEPAALFPLHSDAAIPSAATLALATYRRLGSLSSRPHRVFPSLRFDRGIDDPTTLASAHQLQQSPPRPWTLSSWLGSHRIHPHVILLETEGRAIGCRFGRQIGGHGESAAEQAG